MSELHWSSPLLARLWSALLPLAPLPLPDPHPLPTGLATVLPCPTGSHVSNRFLASCLLIALMETAGTSEKLAKFYQTTQCNNPTQKTAIFILATTKTWNLTIHNLYSSTNITRVIKWRRMRWANMHHALNAEECIHLVKNLKGISHLGDLGIDGRMTLRWILACSILYPTLVIYCCSV
jgi:hypothetical protein